MVQIEGQARHNIPLKPKLNPERGPNSNSVRAEGRGEAEV